jgi:hypothetical protein
MSQELYDVVVVGAAEATPAGEARLCLALSTTHNMAMDAVARGVAEKNLRMGEALARDAAVALVRKLGANGALTSIRKTEATLPEARDVPLPHEMREGPRNGRAPIPTPLQGIPLPGSAEGQTIQGVGPLATPPANPTRAPGRLGPLGGSGRSGSTGTAASTGNQRAGTGTYRAVGNTPPPVRTGVARGAGNTPPPVRTGDSGVFRVTNASGGPVRAGDSGVYRVTDASGGPVRAGDSGVYRVTDASGGPVRAGDSGVYRVTDASGGPVRSSESGVYRISNASGGPIRAGESGVYRVSPSTEIPVRSGDTGAFRVTSASNIPVRSGDTGTFRVSGGKPKAKASAPARAAASGTSRGAAGDAPAGRPRAGTTRAPVPGSPPGLRPLGAPAPAPAPAAHAEPPTPAPMPLELEEPDSLPTPVHTSIPAGLSAPVAVPLDDSGNISLSYDAPSAISSFGMAELPRPAGGKDPFGLPEQTEAPLELVTDSPSASISRPAPITLAGAAGLNTSKITNTAGSSGLRLTDSETGDDNERCPVHGLLYDRRASTGCKKCQLDKDAGKRSATRGAARAPDRVARLRDTPPRRAFLGISLALALGFLPAALYALKPAAGEVSRLRAEQADLSMRAGTEDNLRRFDELETLVDGSRDKAMRNTLIIWVLIGGAVMGAYYKITA